MRDKRTKREAELMKKVRDVYKKVDSNSFDSRYYSAEELEYIMGLSNEAWRTLVRIGVDELEKIRPGAKHILRTDFVPSLGTEFFKLYMELMPQIWRIRRYRQTKELSDKIPGEI